MVKGLSQFLTGMVSDLVGRKPPVVVGLMLNAGGLLVIALGTGYEGALLPPTSDAADLRALQFGYLVSVRDGKLIGL